MTDPKTPQQSVARALRDALNPFVVFTALYAAVAFSEAGLFRALGYLALELLAAGVVAGYVWLMRWRRRVPDFWIPTRAERLVPALIVLLLSGALLAALALTSAPEDLFQATLSMVLATALVAAITLFWKASAHSTVAGHAAVAGPLVLGPWSLVFALALPLVLYARVATRDHTVPQTLVGTAIGAAFAAVFLA